MAIESRMEYVTRLIREDAGVGEFQQEWRLHRSRSEGTVLLMAVVNGVAIREIIEDGADDAAARAAVHGIVSKMTAVPEAV